ncbi:MAG TPA: molybdopterin-dependent oxidoreductase [Streptosporangiaceae bacterium]|nr:molybdopterin-dependent oxidoreductase [Streptosporangiaceae bacterium]
MTSQRDYSRPLRGTLAGLLAGAVAVSVGQFVASLGAQDSSPVIAVGDAAVGLAPPAVKDFAITAFGSDDKLALLTGIYVLLGLYAVAVGLLGLRRLVYGLAGLAAFTVIGLIAAGTRPGSSAGWLVPTLAAAVVSTVTLVLLLRNIPGRARPTAAAEPTAARRPEATGPAADETAALAPADLKPAELEPTAAGRDPLDWTPSTPPPAPLAPGRSPDEQRRWFLRTSFGAVFVAAAGGLAARELAERGAVTTAIKTLRLPRPKVTTAPLPPGTNLNIPGLSPFITPNPAFYLVDTELVLPQVPPDSWKLRIHGMVEREIEITFDELLRRPLIEAWITLCCVSNPVAGPYIGNAKWLGASLASLIREARPRAGADQILSTSVDGYTCGTPVQAVLDGREALLAVGMNGQALPVAHGFPARMVVPGLYGYVSATKWVTDIKLTTFRSEVAYWAQRGWSQQAQIKTESRIDVPNGSKTLKAGRTPVAGVAWAQHRGIDAVEVRVDQGPWHEAKLAAVPGIDTWRQWVWEWDAAPGSHVVEARATDKTGYTQTAVQESTIPNGATGYPQVNVTVT